MRFQLKLIVALGVLGLLLPGQPHAEDPGESSAFKSTELPLPRFASLRSEEVYVRSGPGQRYPVEWVYKKGGLPVEIILEFDTWRKIRDYDQKVGWVHQSMLSGQRSGFVEGKDRIVLKKKPLESAQSLAFIEPKAVVQIKECSQGWCAINASGYGGWVPQKALWGVYESEEFD